MPTLRPLIDLPIRVSPECEQRARRLYYRSHMVPPDMVRAWELLPREAQLVWLYRAAQTMSTTWEDRPGGWR